MEFLSILCPTLEHRVSKVCNHGRHNVGCHADHSLRTAAHKVQSLVIVSAQHSKSLRTILENLQDLLSLA